MTALEYMEKQIQKCKLNYTRAQGRNATNDELNSIIKKIGYYAAAVDALRKGKDDA